MSRAQREMLEAIFRNGYWIMAGAWLAGTTTMFVLHATHQNLAFALAITLLPAFAWASMLDWSVVRAGLMLARCRWLEGLAGVAISVAALSMVQYRDLTYDVFYWTHPSGFECLARAGVSEGDCTAPPGHVLWPEKEANPAALIMDGFLGNYGVFMYRPAISAMGYPRCRAIADGWSLCRT